MTRMDKPYSAPYLAERLKECYDSEGFKIWWAQYQREVRRIEKWVMTSPTKDTAEKTAMELIMRQGFLTGIKKIEDMTVEMLEELEKGRVPWETK